MSDELKTIKFQLMLSPSEAQAIDDWGFQNRIRTRAEAIRKLCQMGILSEGRTKELNGRIQDSKMHYKRLENMIFNISKKHEGEQDFEELRQALDKFMLHYLGISLSGHLTEGHLDSITKSTDLNELESNRIQKD